MSKKDLTEKTTADIIAEWDRQKYPNFQQYLDKLKEEDEI